MKRIIGWAIVALLSFGAVLPAAAQSTSEILTQARRAYYSLQNRGLAQFSCKVAPKWETMLGEMRQANPAQFDQTVALLNLMSLAVTVPVEGRPQVTQTVAPGATPQQIQALRQVQQGIEQMLSGFFDSWSPFVLTSVIPLSAPDAELKPLGNQYELSFTDGASRTFIVMEKDYAIRSMRMDSAGVGGTFSPKFVATPHGLLLTSYAAEFKGATPTEAGTVQVGVVYQAVDDFQIPKTLAMAGATAGTAFKLDVDLTDCQVKRR